MIVAPGESSGREERGEIGVEDDRAKDTQVGFSISTTLALIYSRRQEETEEERERERGEKFKQKQRSNAC
jgi:hypothetical protein